MGTVFRWKHPSEQCHLRWQAPAARRNSLFIDHAFGGKGWSGAALLPLGLGPRRRTGEGRTARGDAGRVLGKRRLRQARGASVGGFGGLCQCISCTRVRAPRSPLVSMHLGLQEVIAGPCTILWAWRQCMRRARRRVRWRVPDAPAGRSPGSAGGCVPGGTVAHARVHCLYAAQLSTLAPLLPPSRHRQPRQPDAQQRQRARLGYRCRCGREEGQE